jgi:hypothetical protein
LFTWLNTLVSNSDLFFDSFDEDNGFEVNGFEVGAIEVDAIEVDAELGTVCGNAIGSVFIFLLIICCSSFNRFSLLGF